MAGWSMAATLCRTKRKQSCHWLNEKAKMGRWRERRVIQEKWKQQSVASDTELGASRLTVVLVGRRDRLVTTTSSPMALKLV